jgi:hypothetical protein
MTEPRESSVPKIREARATGIGPDTDVVVRFSGDIYKWITELRNELKDAEAEEDVPTIGVELLHLARGKEIWIGTGPDAQVLNLWRERAR